MTPDMLRKVAKVSLAIGLLLMLVWLLQQFGWIDWLDNPELGALAAGLITLVTARLANKDDELATPEDQSPSED
jgi:hypothetical protein